MAKSEQWLQEKLQQRKEDLSLRQLMHSSASIDFCSNDYLGFARSARLKQLSKQISATQPDLRNGSGGSRLLSGNSLFTEETETFIARYHGEDSGLIFNSGYDANLGLFSSLPQRGDTIITDELIHASIIDGCRLSHANRFKFAHNNIDDLKEKLKKASGNIFVVVESVYSMDGDLAPLREIFELCQQYQANLIVDEAHATGIFGPQGRGLVNQYGLEGKILARVITFGKALGGHGAIVLGSDTLRQFLINYARSFIYTTAAPIHAIINTLAAYQLLAETDHVLIHRKISLFRAEAAVNALRLLESNSCIQGVTFQNNEETKKAAAYLQSKGYDVRAILSPTVPSGKERLRICIHTFNSDEEIITLVKHLKELNSNG